MFRFHSSDRRRTSPQASSVLVAPRRRRAAGLPVGLVLALSAVLTASFGFAVPSAAAVSAHRAIGWYSSNWAGYMATTGTFASVSGTWTVPQVSTGQSGFSAVWLGIGGVSDNELIQVGTEQDSLYGHASYNAWWEILPAPAVEIHSFSVHPGDIITASVTHVRGRTWRIFISNRGHGTFTTTRTWDGEGTSAEWIVEAPVVNGRVGRLARFSLVTFNLLKANGRNPRLKPSQAGVLIQRGVRVATPSLPDAQGDGFALQRSSTAPRPPGP